MSKYGAFSVSSKTIFVTGGAGFIGANFVLDWLREEGGLIVNLDKLTYAGNLQNLLSVENDSRHVFVRGDIGDHELVKGLLDRYRPWAVVNFAAESHVDRSIFQPGDFIQTNVVGTLGLLKAASAYWESLQGPEKDAFRFLHISTDEVFGSLSPEDLPFCETSAYRPNSPYSASKASSDFLVRAWHHTYGLPVQTTNCSNNYGPYQFPEKMIPLMIHNAVNGKALPIYGDGQNIRDWLYVADHCAAVRCVLKAGRIGETYAVGGRNEMTNIRVVEMICDILEEEKPRSEGKYRSLMSLVKDRPGHDRRYAINPGKIAGELGWKPQETFATGLRKTIRWYLANEGWLRNVTSGDYRHWIAKTERSRQSS